MPQTATPLLIDYHAFAKSALMTVARAALVALAEKGRPGEGNLELSFVTAAQGVECPAGLFERFPQEMSIILADQYWDLTVTEDSFSVVISCDGVSTNLVVPFSALTVFNDVNAQWGVAIPAPPATATMTQVAPAEVAPTAPAEPSNVLQFPGSRRR